MALQEELEKKGNWLFRHRSYLPLLILTVGLAVYVYQVQNSIQMNCISKNSYEFICLSVCFIGLAIRIYTVGYTPEGTSGRNTEEQLAEVLNTTGIYSLLRHPLYLGNFFMWLGPAMLTQHFWFVISFCLFYWIYYERIMYAEEQFLRKKFGQAYLDWAEKTPPFLPRFKNFMKPSIDFSWKKVLRKEKDGFFSACLIISCMSCIGTYLLGDMGFNYGLLAFLGFALLLYLFLQFLKKKTQILSDNH